MVLPRFRVDESWDNTGDVTVQFEDRIEQDLCDRVGVELEERLSFLHEDERSLYHVEHVVTGIFSSMAVNGKLGRKENKWTFVEEGSNEV